MPTKKEKTETACTKMAAGRLQEKTRMRSLRVQSQIFSTVIGVSCRRQHEQYRATQPKNNLLELCD